MSHCRTPVELRSRRQVCTPCTVRCHADPILIQTLSGPRHLQFIFLSFLSLLFSMDDESQLRSQSQLGVCSACAGTARGNRDAAGNTSALHIKNQIQCNCNYHTHVLKDITFLSPRHPAIEDFHGSVQYVYSYTQGHHCKTSSRPSFPMHLHSKLYFMFHISMFYRDRWEIYRRTEVSVDLGDATVRKRRKGASIGQSERFRRGGDHGPKGMGCILDKKYAFHSGKKKT
jgi:hypothetical protein